MKFGVCIVMGVTKKNPIFHWDMCSGFYFTVPFLRHIHDILVNCLAQPRNKALICDQETWHCPEVACTVCQNGSVMLGQSLNISRTTALLVQNITSQSTTIYKSLFFFPSWSNKKRHYVRNLTLSRHKMYYEESSGANRTEISAHIVLICSLKKIDCKVSMWPKMRQGCSLWLPC